MGMVSIACQKKEAKQKTVEAHKNQSARGHSRTCHTLPWHSHKLGSGQTDRRPDWWFDREEDFTPNLTVSALKRFPCVPLCNVAVTGSRCGGRGLGGGGGESVTVKTEFKDHKSLRERSKHTGFQKRKVSRTMPNRT